MYDSFDGVLDNTVEHILQVKRDNHPVANFPLLLLERYLGNPRAQSHLQHGLQTCKTCGRAEFCLVPTSALVGARFWLGIVLQRRTRG